MGGGGAGWTVTGARTFHVRPPTTTTAWNVRRTPTDSAGHVRVPVRRPRKEIQVPDAAPEHGTIAVPVQHPTTVSPRRIWSRILAGSGAPLALRAVTAKRHGWSTTGLGVEVVSVTRAGVAAAAIPEPASSEATSSAEAPARIRRS